MNGQRAVRKYIERLAEEELHGLWKAAQKDGSQEAMVIMHLIICELSDRGRNPTNSHRPSDI